MENRPSFLATLGLLPPCTAEDVKQAYLERVKLAHPDRGGTREQFLELQADYQKALEYAQFFASRRRWISSAIDRHLRHDECLAVIRSLGGRVAIEQIDWLADEIGPDFAQLHERIVAVDLAGSTIADDDLAQLATHEEALASLRKLDLSGTDVGDASLAALVPFAGLEHLALAATPITSAGLKHLAQLERLTWLGLQQTDTGWLAIRSLRRALPDLTVER